MTSVPRLGLSGSAPRRRTTDMPENHDPEGGNARGKVLWHVTMSLDGFIAGHDDSMEWMTGYATSLADEVIRTTGAILAGRRGYELARQRNIKPYGGAWTGPQCVERGLVDELLVHLVPVLLGDGLRLFEEPGGEQVTLERLSLGMSGQLTDLRFRVVK